MLSHQVNKELVLQFMGDFLSVFAKVTQVLQSHYNVGCSSTIMLSFFSIWVFFYDHPRIKGLQGKERTFS